MLDGPTPKALRDIAQVAASFSDTLGGSRYLGVAKRSQPQAKMRNTFGVLARQTTLFSTRVGGPICGQVKGEPNTDIS